MTAPRASRHGPGPDPVEGLRALAARPVPGPDPAFVSLLEDRLRLHHAVRRMTPVVREGRVWRWASDPSGAAPCRLVPTAIAIVLAGAAVLLGTRHDRPRPTGPTVEVSQAVNADYAPSDGRMRPLPDGTHLSDGAVVVTGPLGAVTTSAGSLGPDSEAVVHDGELLPLPATVPHLFPPTGAHPSREGLGVEHQAPARTGGAAAPLSPPAPAGSSDGRPAVPGGPSSPPSAGGGRSGAPVSGTNGDRTATEPTVSGTDAPHSADPHPSSARTGRVHLRADPACSAGNSLAWSGYDNPALYGYALLRRSDGTDPVYPDDVIRFVGTGTASYLDSAGTTSGRYQVDAVDSLGRVLAASNVAVPQLRSWDGSWDRSPSSSCRS